METKIHYGKDARTKLQNGIDKLADAVVATLGPNGKNVVILEENKKHLNQLRME